MIVPTLQQKIGEALKAHDEIRLSTLRLLSSAMNYERIAKQHDLNEEEELNVVRKEAKMRKDAIEAYEKAGPQDRAEKQKTELEILEVYLPKQMSDEELSTIVDEVLSTMNITSPAEMGKAIGAVMAKVKGVADGSRVSTLIKEKLAK
jgi:uncharacterized protein YqeY